ncbi:MAG: hypothetical protein LBD27_04290, partial [Tannerella sp.]|nr:hypothetical protein [Tannerella sp.]
MATVKFTHLDAFKLKLGNVAGLASETLHETTPLLPKLGEVGAKIATKLDADLATMKSEMDKTPGSPLTEAIRQANKACDDTLNEIKRTTKVASQSTVTLKAEAGAVLMHFLEGFWHLDREPILTQIAMTREL